MQLYPVAIFLVLGGRTEGVKFVGDDRAYIPVLDFGVVHVLFRIECLEVEPAAVHRVFEAPQAVQDGALKCVF